MIRKAALALFLLITATTIALLAIAGTRPAAFHVERSATTSAPPQAVFEIVNDLHRFPDWSPWQKLDPAMRSAVEGSGVGPGSSYSWAGNDQVGEGRMTITASTPSNHVELRLEFRKPWKSTSDVQLRILPDGEGSQVTWAMDGTNNFMAKVMTLFMSMDSMLGKDFESGLANLKRVSEAAPPAPAAAAADSSGAHSAPAAGQ
jgi:polyketide cyclase/dehydrase/lipid transport protein